MTEPTTQPVPGGVCPRCQGQGIVVQAGERCAEASRCACQSPCATCRGEGYLVVDAPSTADTGAASMRVRPVRVPCPTCAPLDRRARLYTRARVPRRFAARTLDSFEPRGARGATIKAIVTEVAQGLEPGVQGVLLAGPPGVGKTHLLAGIVRVATLDMGLDTVFVDFFELLSDLRAAFGKGQGEADLLDPILARSVIAIDELGKGKNSEWEAGVLDQLVSRAYNTERVLLVTTNYLPQAYHASVSRRLDETLEERVGDRVASRLAEMCRTVVLDGEDARLMRPDARRKRA